MASQTIFLVDLDSSLPVRTLDKEDGQAQAALSQLVSRLFRACHRILLRRWRPQEADSEEAQEAAATVPRFSFR